MSLVYADSPLSEYLKDAGEDEEVIHDDEAPLFDQEVMSSRPPSGASDDQVASRSATAETNAAPDEPPADPFAELLKYSLATSSLLSPRLSDAITLYPSLDSLTTSSSSGPQQSEVTSTTTNPSSQDPPPEATHVSGNSGTVLLEGKEGSNIPSITVKPVWGDNWDTRGHSWRDRSFAGNALEVVSILAGASVGVTKLFTKESTPSTESSSLPLPPVPPPSETPATAPKAQEAKTSTVHTSVLDSAASFAKAAQELDLRIGGALSAIKEVECIGWGLGLSHPLPPVSRLESASLSNSTYSTSSGRARVPSPLGFASTTPELDSFRHFPPQSHSRSQSSSVNNLLSSPTPASHHGLRAKQLRLAIANTLSSITTALNNSRVSLKHIQGVPDTLSYEALERHEAEAAKDRFEAEERERRLRDWDAGISGDEMEGGDEADGLKFGGVDRTTGLASSTGSIRHRPDAGPSSPHSSKRSSVSMTTPRKRPLSLSMWPQPQPQPSLSAISPIQQSLLRDSDDVPPTPQQKSGARFFHAASDYSASDDEGSGTTTTTLSLTGLQSTFEEMHSVRRGLLWRLLSMADLGLNESLWKETLAVLDELEKAMKEGSGIISKEVELEFGSSGLGTETLSIGRRAGESKRSSMLFGGEAPAAPYALSASVGRRMGGHGRSQSANSYNRPASWHGGPPGARPLSLSFGNNFSILNHSSMSTSPISPARGPRHGRPLSMSFPASGNNFAPSHPNPSQGPAATLATLDTQAQSMGLALRSIAAKLHVVTEDAKRRVGSPNLPGSEVERLISTHDSIRTDLEALTREFDDSRIALRQLVKPVGPPSTLSRSDSYQDSDGLNTSLDSIPDVEGIEVVEGLEDQGEDDGESLFSSEIETPDSTPPRPAGMDDDLTINGKENLPPPGDELVFEAVAGRREGGREASKLSREERIKALQEQRRATRAASASSGTGAAPGSGGVGSLKTQAGMVAELKDVLTLLKSRRHLPADV
ncbi:hypothetical protein T439DRAFT_384067 [Meredithblackwellia eburnea MCA 4105]